ncbi:MAG: HAD-IIIA family hydrolase [Chloroflexota bacterium]
MAPERPPGATILFDKDGTLIENVPYNVDPARIRLIRGGHEPIRRLAGAGFDAAIVTNQSGVARGYFTLEDLDAVRDRVAALLAELGMSLRGFYACPHLPTGSVPAYAIACTCRKPGSGLVRQAIDELGLVAADTWLVGDSWADVLAGRGAGCRTALVGSEWRLGRFLPPGKEPEISVPSLAEAADAILARVPSGVAG